MNKKAATVFVAFLCLDFGDVLSPFTSLLQQIYDLSKLVARYGTDKYSDNPECFKIQWLQITP